MLRSLGDCHVQCGSTTSTNSRRHINSSHTEHKLEAFNPQTLESNVVCRLYDWPSVLGTARDMYSRSGAVIESRNASQHRHAWSNTHSYVSSLYTTCLHKGHTRPPHCDNMKLWVEAGALRPHTCQHVSNQHKDRAGYTDKTCTAVPTTSLLLHQATLGRYQAHTQSRARHTCCPASPLLHTHSYNYMYAPGWRQHSRTDKHDSHSC